MRITKNFFFDLQILLKVNFQIKSFSFSGLNGKVSYSITSGDDGEDFNISSNGTIYTAKLLDRETIPMYNLVITARDLAKSPEPQLSSTVQVTIF